MTYGYQDKNEQQAYLERETERLRDEARLMRESDAARARVEQLEAALTELRKWLLLVVTEGDASLGPSAICPLCYSGEPGNFHSANPDDHWDNCAWPLIVEVLEAAND